MNNILCDRYQTSLKVMDKIIFHVLVHMLLKKRLKEIKLINKFFPSNQLIPVFSTYKLQAMNNLGLHSDSGFIMMR